MAIPIDMPKLSDTMTEGTLLKWLKKEGDTVEVGDVIAEVETDKATMEMEAFDDGVIHAIYAKEGDKVAVGSRLALLLEEGEEAPSGDEAPPEAEKETPKKEKAEKPSEDQSSDRAPAKEEPRASGERIKASPLARKIAAEKNIDLASLTGSGPGGRIVKSDVLSAKLKAASTGASSIPTIRAKAGADDERIALTGMRTIIAERLSASKTQIPHFYLNIDIDAAPLLAFREQINKSVADREGSNKYTINDFILKAVVSSAVAVPETNASFDGDAIIRFASVNLSVAIAVEDGLVTPVIKDAQNKTLLDISKAVKDLAERARSKKLKPDEFAGGTLTVSTLGAYGIESFDAIINPPQAFIISVSAITKKPVVNEKDEIVIGHRMKIGMSCDHRVIDGAIGAQYLSELRQFIENPALMLL